MITLEDNQLVFRFPEIHDRAAFSLGFQRTLRIPDDGKTYPLPAGLGNFSLHHTDDYASKLPTHISRRGGVMMPMWASEAMWINFNSGHGHDYRGFGGDYPFAIKVGIGKINAITGKPWSEALSDDPQDYVVVPRQKWIDGIAVQTGVIRQFVASRLGDGHSVEEQIAGAADHGGIQILAYPMKADSYEDYFQHSVGIQFCFPPPSSLHCEIGLSAGGKMRQEIYQDPFGIDAWDQTASSRCFVTILNAETWHEVTGGEVPPKPITPQTYASEGLPWFDYYDTSAKPLGGSMVLDKVKSIFAGKEVQSTMPIQVTPIGPSQRPVREEERPAESQTGQLMQDRLLSLNQIAEALKLLQQTVAAEITEVSKHVPQNKPKKGPKTILRVVQSGDTIIHDHAADTLAEVIRRIGVERVHALHLKLGGLPLVSMSPPPPDRGYRHVDGRYVTTHASNSEKKTVLEEIARRMDLDLRIDVLKSVA